MKDPGKIKGRNPFNVPEGYFEDMTGKLISTISVTQAKSRIPFLSLIKPHLMLAAAMIGFALISYTVVKHLLPDRPGYSMDIETADLTEYISQQVDESVILEHFNNEANESDDFDLDNDEIIEYLINENIDYLTIYENL